MPARGTIGFAESAVADLEDIRAWYAEREVPEIGERLVKQILSQVERLLANPESGRIVPEFGLALLREIILPPFRIVYRLDDGEVRIVRVWRSERRLQVP